MAIDYTSIDEVVNDFQLTIDDTSYDKDAQIYQLRLLALQGLRELKFDAEQEVKTATMLVDSTTLQVTLPNDYVKLFRIGYRSSFEDGFVSLGYKSDLTLDASISAEVGSDNYDENNPYYHVDIGRKFGVGGGNNTLGYYRINRDDNTINFSSDLAGKTVFMEYISDGISNIQPVDHVIEFTFNAAHSEDADNNGIRNSAVVFLPSTTSSTDITRFTFKLDTDPTSNTDVKFSGTDSGAVIAEKFSNVINEGYPDFRLSASNSKIKASHKSNVVTLTFSDITVVLNSFNDSNLSLNLGQNVAEHGSASIVPLLSQRLLQLGVVGDGPKVHKFCEEALRCYIYYKYIQRKRGVPANEKQMAKRAYYNEKRLARARMMSFNKEAAMQVSRKAFKQSPKL